MSSLWNVLSLFPDVSSIVGVIVYLILSAFNKQLVTLKFEDYSDMFSFVRGKKVERIFFFWTSRLSVIPHPFCRFSLDLREGNEQQKGHFITDWSLKLKVSYNEKSPNNLTYFGNILVKGNVINSKSRGIK